MELTPADRRYLIAASEVMLRPFEHPTPLKYLVAVSQQIEPLIGAFASMCGTRDPEGTIGLDSASWSADAKRQFARWKLNDSGMERAVTQGVEIPVMRKLVAGDWDLLDKDPMWNEWYRPRGIRDVAGYILHWPEDDALALVELHGDRFGTDRFGDDGECLLSLLQPAFRAGMRLLYTVGQLREAVARDMDTLGVPLCVCSREGRIHHMSTAVRMLLADDPESARVVDRIPEVAGEVAAGGRARSAACRELPSCAAHAVVTTARRRYRLSAALATHAMQFGRTDVLVTIGALEHAGPDGDAASRFGLSPREWQVALLLTRGMGNRDVARILNISVHTAKRHTERVFEKLGVTTRAAVAARLGVASARNGHGA